MAVCRDVRVQLADPGRGGGPRGVRRRAARAAAALRRVADSRTRAIHVSE